MFFSSRSSCSSGYMRGKWLFPVLFSLGILYSTGAAADPAAGFGPAGSAAIVQEESKEEQISNMILLKDRAEEGDADAQFELGRRYLQGTGLDRNDVMALHWLEAAAKQGHVRAEAGLGWMYAVGRGVKRDPVKSFEWFEKAAKKGYAVAQRMLAKSYVEGSGTERNMVLAREWYEKAAAQGDERSIQWLKDTPAEESSPDAAAESEQAGKSDFEIPEKQVQQGPL